MSSSEADTDGGSPAPRRQWVGAAAVASLYVLVDRFEFGGRSLLADVGSNARSDFYLSIAASCAALLGFTITASSILTTLGSGPRIQWLRNQPEFQQTRVVLMGAIHALAAGTVIYTGLIVLDTGDVGSWPLEALAAGVLVLVCWRLGWVIWLLNNILELSLGDERERARPLAGRPLPFNEPLDDPQ
jgi:hypothetical protein